MKALCSTLTSKGQITVPSYIRNKLSINSGSKVEFIMQEDSFIVVPISRQVKSLKGILPKPAVPLTVDEMSAVIKGSYDRN